MGDSGAFTAWTQGASIDLAELIDWCLWYSERKPGFVCISLDVIPGQPGGNREPTTHERERATEESLANGDAMREAGLLIMEVYHVFEPISHLDLLLDRRQPGEFVGVGGLVGRSSALKRQVADAVFSRVRERNGGWSGIPPLHALGINVLSEFASRYPWASLDSSSWVASARYGKGIRKNGTTSGRHDARISNPSVRHLHLERVLRGWQRREAVLSNLWSERGVIFAE